MGQQIKKWTITLSEVFAKKPIFEKLATFTKVRHEVDGMEKDAANAKAHLTAYKTLATLGGDINETKEFIERFAGMREYDRKHTWFALFFSVRKCIEEFYFANITSQKTMQYGYWKSIFEVLKEDKVCRLIFNDAFELSGCRQGADYGTDKLKPQKGSHVYVEESYWISTPIVEHYAGVKKIADTQAARKELQEAVANALHNKPPHWKKHEQVKARFAKELANWTRSSRINSFYP